MSWSISQILRLALCDMFREPPRIVSWHSMQHRLLGALCMQLRVSSQVVSGMLWCKAAPAILRVATRAMSSLQEAYEGVVQYLEAAARGEVNAEDPIILAAIRSLARWNMSRVLTFRV